MRGTRWSLGTRGWKSAETQARELPPELQKDGRSSVERHCNNACVSKDRFAWAWGLGPRGGKHWVVSKDGVTVNSNRGWGETAVPLSGSSVGPYFKSPNPNVTGLFL